MPKCFGDPNKRENLVLLTAREHFIAHLLLVNIYSGNIKLIYAASAMYMNKSKQRINSRSYDWLKRKINESKIGRISPHKNRTYEEIYGIDLDFNSIREAANSLILKSIRHSRCSF